MIFVLPRSEPQISCSVVFIWNFFLNGYLFRLMGTVTNLNDVITIAKKKLKYARADFNGLHLYYK